MKDEALQSVWDSRKVIAEECHYDAHRLVRFMQEHARKRESEQATPPDGASRRSRRRSGTPRR